MNFDGAKERFFEFHPQLNVACRSVAKEVSGERSYQPMQNKLKQAVWHGLDALTGSLFAVPTNGKTVNPKGLILVPSIQQSMLDMAVVQVCGPTVTAPRISPQVQLQLTSMVSAVCNSRPLKCGISPGVSGNVGGDGVREVDTKTQVSPEACTAGVANSAQEWLQQETPVSGQPGVGGIGSVGRVPVNSTELANMKPDDVASMLRVVLQVEVQRDQGNALGHKVHGSMSNSATADCPWRSNSVPQAAEAAAHHTWPSNDGDQIGNSFGPSSHNPANDRPTPYEAVASASHWSTDIPSGSAAQSEADNLAFQSSGAFGQDSTQGERAVTAAGQPGELFAGYYNEGSRMNEQSPGRYRFYLKSRPDGGSLTDVDVIALAKKSGFLSEDKKKVQYRTTPGYKGKGKKGMEPKPYGMILKPRYGKGNITVFLRTGLVQVNCSDGVYPRFVQAIEGWTTCQPY